MTTFTYVHTCVRIYTYTDVLMCTCTYIYTRTHVFLYACCTLTLNPKLGILNTVAAGAARFLSLRHVASNIQAWHETSLRQKEATKIGIAASVVFNIGDLQP